MFNSYYCNDEKQARPISELIQAFETSGTEGLNVACGEELSFTAEEWKAKSDKEKPKRYYSTTGSLIVARPW